MSRSKEYEPVSSAGWFFVGIVAGALLLLVAIVGVLVHGSTAWWFTGLLGVTLWTIVGTMRGKSREIGENREHAKIVGLTPRTEADRRL